MRIGIETECLNHPITGVQLATLDLIKGLIAQDNQLTCFHTKSTRHPHFEKVRHHLFRGLPSIPCAKAFFSLFHSSCFEQVDLLHLSAPRFSYLIRPQVPLVLTIHDIGPLLHPRFYGKKVYYFYKYFLPKYLNDVDAVITSTQFNKSELLKHFHLKDEKIHVVPFGLSNPPRPSQNKKEQILLYIGTRHPRKNIQALLDAYTLLLSEGVPHKLVLLGNPLNNSELSAWVKKNPKFEHQLLNKGFVSEKEKQDWLQRASLLIMPSLYEGFGFPILEALSSGTPVIGSSVSAIPEVLGEGGILIDPHDPQSIATAISEALSSSDTYERLVQKALKRAAQFSHTRMIDQALSIYKQIL